MQYLNLQLYLPEKTKTASKNPFLIAFSPPVPSDPPVITLSTCVQNRDTPPHTSHTNKPFIRPTIHHKNTDRKINIPVGAFRASFTGYPHRIMFKNLSLH